MRKTSKRTAHAIMKLGEGGLPRLPSGVTLEVGEVYQPWWPIVAKAMRSRGATDAEICLELNISRKAFLLWQEQVEEFSKACSINEDAQVRRVEDKLYERAIGYVRTEQKVVFVNGRREVVSSNVEVAPDLDAIKFFLANKDPKNWKLKPEGAAVQPLDNDLAALLKQMSTMRTSRIRPVALRPGEEKTLE